MVKLLLRQLLCVVFVVIGNVDLNGQKNYYPYIVVDDFEGTATLNSINWETQSVSKVPNYFGAKSQYLIVKLSVADSTDFIDIPYPTIEELSLYVRGKSGLYEKIKTIGVEFPFYDREIDASSLVFDIRDYKQFDYKDLVLVARSRLPIYVPISELTYTGFIKSQHFGFLFFGAYMGVFIALLLYNLFLYFSTVDKSYLPYLVFLIFCHKLANPFSYHTKPPYVLYLIYLNFVFLPY